MLSSPVIRSIFRHVGLVLVLPIALVATVSVLVVIGNATAQGQGRRALTLRADVQQANARTGVVTARGNVQLNYPARQIQATAAQAQYFSREHRIVLSGNVYVLQEGNSLRAETVTYLIDEGRFVALPLAKQQVESIILVPDTNASAQSGN
jgi:lipopolysaccharide export system protein LptA